MRLLALCLSVVVQAAASPALTSESLFAWRTPSNPQISPDGKRVVYVLETADRFADAFHSTLWIVSTDGKDHRPLSSGKWKDSLPRWSPDGSKLAYLSTRAGKPQIFVRWMDTGAEARITDLENSPAVLSWSPDGEWLAFLARVPGKPGWSITMPKAPTGATWADPPVVETRLKWRADGVGGIGQRPLGFAHLFVVPVTGGTPRQLSDGDYDHGGDPSWMPDGKSIVVHGARREDADAVLYGDDIWRFSLDGGKPVQLTKVAGTETNPLVSPDGKYIAFTGFPDKGFSSHNTNLYVMNADGTGLRQLAAGLDRSVSAPQWEAGSRGLLAIVEDSGKSHFYRVPVDGSAVAVTAGNGRYATAYASAEAFSLSKGGRVAVSYSSPNEPKDIVTFAVGGAMTRLTETNKGLMAGRAIGKVEEIVWKSFDGRAMQGWLIYPPGFDAARKYPLILDIHGGPHAMYGVEFNQQMQIFAARGFVVFYANPRGSTGYGEEFGNVIHGNY
ncbi:MAG: DPP IV N-terminal domain-containing protein, partial [Saprospiraceae bacterium]